MNNQERRASRFHESYEIAAENRLLAHKGALTMADRVARLRRRWRFQFLPHYFIHPPSWRVTLRKFGGQRRVLPNFACVGPIKSGSSDFANYLFLHPAVLPPLAKEIPSARRDVWRPYYPTRAEFERVQREQGKALTGYFFPLLHRLPVIDELRRIQQDMKIILLLRDPVQRAYSHYKWELFLGGPAIAKMPYFRTFFDYVSTAIELFPSVEMPTACRLQVLETRIYDAAVALWMQRFGRENVHIVASEDFFADPNRVATECFEFLGVPPIEVTPFKVINPNPLDAPTFDAKSRALLEAFYRPYNERLYAVIGRDLGG